MAKSILRGFVVLAGAGSLVACGANAPGGSGSDAPVDHDAPAIDGAVPDAAIDAAVDAAPPAPRCDPAKPFGTPTLIPGVNAAGRDVQGFLVDDLTLFWSTDRGGTTDIYYATRSSPTGTFGNATPLTGFATNGTEISAVLTADRLTMYYAYAPQGVTPLDIYVATRATPTGTFGAGTAVSALDQQASDDGDVTVTGDAGLVYFASDRNAGATGYDIFVGTRSGNTFTNVGPATELNSSAYDAHPRITENGLRIYFSSMRTAGGALGGADIWTASRTSVTDPFGAPTRVAELATPQNESPTWISPDGCVIFLQSDRPNNVGGQDLWEAVKPL